MDPISSSFPNLSVSSLSAAVQALLLQQGLQPGDVEALFQAIGQELSVLYLGQGPEGVRLELPGGRMVTAQGELPFPEGTQLRVRVDTVAGELKMQTLEAKPPATPTLLAPLVQGEAAVLTARLLQASPPPELAPLVQLLKTLGGLPEPATAAAPQSALPSPALLARAMALLPPEQLASLTRVLGAPDMAPEALAAKILALVKEPNLVREGLPEVPGNPGEVSRGQASVAGELLLRFQGLLQQAEIPEVHRGALDGWIRSLLVRSGSEGAVPASPPQAARAANGRATAPPRLLTPAEATRVEGALKAHPGPALEVPEAWEAWVKGSVRALADPAVSPREAPFHALQAREGTAYFEIPLPWAGGQTLQLWVEEDAPSTRAPEQEEVRRVLLSVNLTRLGETRVGLQSAGGTLAVRIWTEHPDLLESQRGELERELAETGRVTDLRILPLIPGLDGRIPDLRALVGGTGLHAMG